MNNWDIDNEELEFETASWHWMGDETICIDPENDEFIPNEDLDPADASWRWMPDEIICIDPENDEFIPQQE